MSVSKPPVKPAAQYSTTTGRLPLQVVDIPPLFESILNDIWHLPDADVDELVIEFLLPFALLGLPVDQWDVEGDTVPHPLAVDHPVVVRCRDRPRNSYALWREKSRRLNERRGGVRWVDPDDIDNVRHPAVCGPGGRRRAVPSTVPPCSGRILGRWFDLGLRHRHDRHPCLSRWLTGCW